MSQESIVPNLLSDNAEHPARKSSHLTRHLLFLLPCLVSICEALSAQQGPIVPCTDCGLVTIAPYPESGLWYNPQQSGSGLDLEIQNGHLVGTLYGYNELGKPEWWQFSGPLVRSELKDVLWELDAEMLRFEGGNCPGCAYQPASVSGDTIAVRLEFQQRNYLKISYSDSTSQYYIPLMFGGDGYKFFPETTDHLFPALGGRGEHYEDSHSDFVFVYRPQPIVDQPQEHLWRAFTIQVRRETETNHNTADNSKEARWHLTVTPNQLEVLFVGEISCRSYPGIQPEEPPSCHLEIIDFLDGSPERLKFRFPAAWFGDSRIYTEAEDGSTLEGYRLDYD